MTTQNLTLKETTQKFISLKNKATEISPNENELSNSPPTPPVAVKRTKQLTAQVKEHDKDQAKEQPKEQFKEQVMVQATEQNIPITAERIRTQRAQSPTSAPIKSTPHLNCPSPTPTPSPANEHMDNIFRLLRQKSGVSKENILEAVDNVKKHFHGSIPERDNMSILYYSILHDRADYLQMLLKHEEKTGALHNWDDSASVFKILRHAMGKSSESLRILLADERLTSDNIEQKITPEHITQLLDSTSSLSENKYILKNHLPPHLRSELGSSKNGKINFAQEDLPTTTVIVKKKRTLSRV